MNLTEGTFDETSSKISQISTKVLKDRGIYSFKEISTGMNLLETKSQHIGLNTQEWKGSVERKSYIEMILWRSEELSKAMSKFLRIRGFDEVDTESMDRDEFIASEDNFKATG